MAANPVARLGDSSSHGGVIITSGETVVQGAKVALVGSLHSCPIPDHGITPITTGSASFKEGNTPVARSGSICGCGAVIIGGGSPITCD